MGNKLKQIKKLREDNSYEFFIISHQINHTVLDGEFLRAYEPIKRLNMEYLEFALNLLLDYINSLEYKEHFISFLKDSNRNHIWAFENLKRHLKAQKIDDMIICEIFELINEELLDRIKPEIHLDDSFFNPIRYDTFSDKNIKMKEFIEHIDALVSEDSRDN